MKNILIAACAALTLTFPAFAADYTLKVSLETGPNHIRNIILGEIAKDMEEASDGRLALKIFHGASQYKGRDVATALAQNALDMGFPGVWHLAAILPEFNLNGLPMFYGMPREVQYKVWDGATGQEMNRRIEEKLGVVVLGPWMDLGYGTMFFTKQQVTELAELEGMKIRAPGGASYITRFNVFGATAVSIPFPDVPQALQRGTIDGVSTSHESVRAAKLWDAGLKYALDDYQVFNHYVPIVSRQAWEKLPGDLQTIVREAWLKSVGKARDLAAERQASAIKEGARNGISYAIATQEDRANMRKRLMAVQPALIKELRIDPELVALAKSDLGM